MDNILGVLREDFFLVSKDKAYAFFYTELTGVLMKKRVRSDELDYVANVLAHYAQVSCFDTSGLPTPINLSVTFDLFFGKDFGHDSALLEVGGSQIILMAGFFHDQMVRRYNINWYVQEGQFLYDRVAQHARDIRRREFFGRLAYSLPEWVITCRDLSRDLRKNQQDYLLLKL